MPWNFIKYLGFILACSVVVFIFVTASTFIQLAAGIVVYPLMVILGYKLFSNRMLTYTPKSVAVQKPIDKPTEKVEAQGANIKVADIDKRLFLKLIGGTGLTLFLVSLFGKKTEDIFFKTFPTQDKISITDSEGKKITPAQNQLLDGYRIAEIEGDIVSFYGFVNKNGDWYVLRVDTVAGSFRYAKGNKDFPLAWQNRETLEYGYFNDIFNN